MRSIMAGKGMRSVLIVCFAVIISLAPYAFAYAQESGVVATVSEIGPDGKVIAKADVNRGLAEDADLDRNDPVVPHAIAHKNLEPGASILLTGSGITRAAVNLPDIVDLVVVSQTEVILNAKAEGKAVVRIWDAIWKPVTYYVTVIKPKPEPEAVAADICAQIGVSTISVQASQTGIVLSGTAKSEEQIKRAEYIAQGTGLKVLNLVKLDTVESKAVVESLKAILDNPALTFKELPDNTVLITGDVPTTTEVLKIRDIIGAYVGELQTTSGSGAASKSDAQTGFSGAVSMTVPDAIDRAKTEVNTTEDGGVVVGQEVTAVRSVFSGRVPNGPRVVAVLNVDLATAKQVLVTAQVLEVDKSKLKDLGVNWGSAISGKFEAQPFFALENAGDTASGIGSIPIKDGLNSFSRLPFAAQINALVTNNYARILSEPKLLIADGHSASILVGGELPVPIAQNSSIGVSSITVQYKPFGIQLTVRPKIGDDNRISMTVTPEVSGINNDPNYGVRTGGITVPALTVRRATTTVHVQNSQALAIGGLLSSDVTKYVSQIPLLSKIPVIGELFKSKNFVERQTELIIVVTPQLIEKDANAPIPVPQDGD